MTFCVRSPCVVVVTMQKPLEDWVILLSPPCARPSPAWAGEGGMQSMTGEGASNKLKRSQV
jgi:hypothetical protein